jgi:serine/threonine-protein kinase
MDSPENVISMGPQPGSQLDHYRLDRLVVHDRGTTTFQAMDLNTNQLVAIEIPDPEIEADPVLFERFQREEEASKALDHPGLIKVIGKGVGKSGHPGAYMVKEWFEGVTLREVLSRGKIASERAIHLTITICEVVEFVHKRGIVLLDVEPEHVLVGPDDRVKLNHLGVSSKFGTRRLTFTKLSQIVGSSQYISPEELKGQKVDARSDIYSIGLMFYEMLTGQLPFQGTGVYDRLARHLIPPRELDPSISPQLQEVLYRALEREPRNRYATALELETDLTHLDRVGVANRPEINAWRTEGSLSIKKLATYAALALIPIAVFIVMLLLARR